MALFAVFALLLAASICVSGFFAIAIVARVARRDLDAPTRVAFRWDVDVEAADRTGLGIQLSHIAMPNAGPDLVDVLAGIARRAGAPVLVS